MTDLVDSFPFYKHVSRVEILPPSDGRGWITRVDFHLSGNGEMERIEFESSGRFLTHYDLLMGFDSVEIIDRNQDGNHLEFGRYELRIYVDDQSTKCDVDKFQRISATGA